MPFNKRKQQRAKALDDSRLQVLQQFDAAIEEAKLIKDPAKKILRLNALDSEIGRELYREYDVIDKKAGLSAAKVAGSGTVVSGAAGIGALAATVATGGIGGIIFIPLLAGSFIAADKHGDSVEAKLKAKIAGHSDKLEQRRTHISKMMNAVVNNSVKEIAQSPYSGDVLALPGLTEKFAQAAARHIAAPQTPVAARPADAAPKNLRIKKKARKHFKIKEA